MIQLDKECAVSFEWNSKVKGKKGIHQPTEVCTVCGLMYVLSIWLGQTISHLLEDLTQVVGSDAPTLTPVSVTPGVVFNNGLGDGNQKIAQVRVLGKLSPYNPLHHF